MNKKEDICPHGLKGWFTAGQAKEFTKEYREGTYPGVYCCHDDCKCPWTDYHECAIYDKFEKE